jgi:predicted DNA-binding transcriptional regulator AlpA
MRSTRDAAERQQVNADLEAIEFGLGEIAAIAQQLIEIVAKLQGRVPPAPLPTEKPVPNRNQLSTGHSKGRRRGVLVTPGTEWLNMRQAAELAGTSRQMIWRWCRHGLPFTRAGGSGRARIRHSALKAFIEK